MLVCCIALRLVDAFLCTMHLSAGNFPGPSRGTSTICKFTIGHSCNHVCHS